MNREKIKKLFAGHGRLAKFFAVSVAFLLFSCRFSNGENQKKERIKVVNWNLQTFFDATFDGNEYTEYKSAKSGWNQSKYEERLDRLASVIKKLDADVFIMEELEKEAQILDIANRLSGTFDFSSLYTQGFFATNEGASIGCAVLSRYPIEDISVHAIDFRGEEKQPSMRPVIQFTLSKNGKSLTIFVNHWKSKSGGAESSEIWRKRQEMTLARVMKKAKGKNNAVLAAGDFNKDISEFDIIQNEEDFSGKPGELKEARQQPNIILHGEENLAVYSPWILENGGYTNGGSYWYKENWERIDHFFAAGEIELNDFCAESEGEWAYEDGHPRRYQIWNGKGYSDHLPISCTVTF